MRFIPAGAGNGSGPGWHPTADPVHPRRRGERGDALERGHIAVGSSPQARGTGKGLGYWSSMVRFIPAGAGNGLADLVQILAFAVHPRRRGEREDQYRQEYETDGSSPQARGTAPRDFRYPEWKRFIPAGAGNGACIPPRWRGTAVHPRRRGERGPSTVQVGKVTGSSPQARGTAGTCASAWACRTVHPRRRGERSRAGESGTALAGSSPQARGTGGGAACQDQRERFIPAGAGNGKPTGGSPGS